MKLFEDYKYRALFGTAVKCPLPEEMGKFLAEASLSNLKKVIPPILAVNNVTDLLPIAMNACVVNMGNKRGDMIATDVALSVYKFFVNKFINIEHDRKVIVGHTVKSSLSKFSPDYMAGGGSEPIEESEVKEKLDPFNITLSGYIYASAYPDVVNDIIKSNNPDAQEYLSISSSWEIAFDSYAIAIGNSSILSECEIISDPEEVEKYSKFLKCNNGTGIANDGRNVWRLVTEGVIPLGIGLTIAPAGHVAGVATSFSTSEIGAEEAVASKKCEEKSSQSNKDNVTINTTMKTLASLDDIKMLDDNTVKEYSLANLRNVLEAGISEISQRYSAEVLAEKTAKQDAEKNAKEALANVTQLQNKLSDLENRLQAEAAERAFNERMSSLDEEYELNDKQRQAIAKQIGGMTDEAFASWKTETFEAFAADWKKGKDKKEDKKEDGKDSKKEDKKEMVASVETVVHTAVANATTPAAVPNTPTPAKEKTLLEKYRDKGVFAFGKDGGLEVELGSRKNPRRI